MKVLTEERVPVKLWSDGVTIEDKAIQQYRNIAKLPFVTPYVAAMPDSHWGNGGPVGAVVPTEGAIVPSLCGVDIGCGMMAVRTNLSRACLAGVSLTELRTAIEKDVPHGRTNNGGPGDRGAWGAVPNDIQKIWLAEFLDDVFKLDEKHPASISKNREAHLGTLGTGNHFIEVSIDESDQVWVVLHSGSRGFGNRIGSYFTKLAKKFCEDSFISLPDPELAYLPVSQPEFHDYISALHLAQRYAWRNREIMMRRVLTAIGAESRELVHCHHNYMAEETHFGKRLYITRKGAVYAGFGSMVIIPGSMGSTNNTFICRGLGSTHSFMSCSHGAGRALGRREAQRTISLEDHQKALAGLVCHSGLETVDESPAAYKPLEAVLAAEADLVTPVHRLSAIICVKGWEK